ncbi:fibronectin type III domain-containing protein [Chengkuizengella axinellae]|uniref:glucan endo-1,3-beta-D-glucosidase n=1 Tax=Chengkuizengella axinellae TaxID=3064388 RepID=A0ABT9J2C5_9BACL|nr:glycosyl hydrolase [Chengkuizengella sp. 2205SS18-9]MDP5275742.1 glycosyl hydrolase [Chengkuizengella sp. 2205SS18-9]
MANTKKRIYILLSILLVFSIFPASFAVQAFDGEVQQGSGSYTTILPPESSAPPSWDLDIGQLAYPEPQIQIYSNVTGPDAPTWKPTPTSDWWTNMNWNTFSEPQYPHPLAVYPKTQGLQIYYPGNSKIIKSTVPYPEQNLIDATLPKDSSHDFVLGHSSVGGFSEARAGGFSDWFVTADFYNGGTGMSISYGHGSPFVYATYAGGNPTLRFGNTPELFIGDANDSMIGISVNGNYYGLFGPSGSSWNGIGSNQLTNLLPNGKNYFSAALLPDVNSEEEAIEVFHLMKAFAYSHITDTTAIWEFDDISSSVETTFQFTITPKEAGAPTETLMTLYPTQWRDLDEDYTVYTYHSLQGLLKTLVGNSFSISDQFTGVLPNAPYLDHMSSQDISRMKAYLTEEISEYFPHSDRNPVDAGTYFTGKELLRLTTLLGIADDLANRATDPVDQAEFRDLADEALTMSKNLMIPWLDASEQDGIQDNSQFFYYNENWGAMIGYREEFWSAPNLTDQHFHIGQYIKAAAEIARVDEQFAADYGQMVDLLIRHIASPDPEDPMFPYLRNFDPYAGHSWADGKSPFAAGNNQESVSEAIMAWTGIILWGEATGNTEFRDLGIYLYTSEMEAAKEYWFDLNDDIYPDEWEQVSSTIIWGGQVDNGTFFSANPAKRHAIIWLPFHGGSYYLGHDQDYVLENYNSLQDEIPEFISSGLASPNEEYWEDLQWMYLALADPDQSLQLLNNAMAGSGSPQDFFTVEEGNSMAFTYSWIHTLNEVGKVDESISADYPFYTVFQDDNGNKTYVVYNMTNTTKTVNFSDGQQIIVAPKSFNTDQGTYIPDTNPPSIPENLEIARIASNYAVIQWDDSTDDRAVVGYDVFVNGVYHTSSVESEAIVEGLSVTTEYSITVKAKDQDTISEASAPLIITTTIVDTEAPAIPQGIVSLSETFNSITLSWSASSDNILTVEYDIYRDNVKIATSEETSFKDTGLEAVTVYDYQIVARDAEGNESPRSVVTKLRSGFLPGPGYTQEIVESSETEATFYLYPNSSIDTAILHLQVVGGPLDNPTLIENDGVFSYNASNIPENASLEYSFTTISNGVGTDSEVFSYTMGEFVNQEPDLDPPTAPSNLAASGITESTVDLNWDASTDNVGVAGYDIYQDSTYIASTTSTTYTVTGLLSNTTYTFEVKAKDEAGNESSISNSATVTTTAPDPTAPTSPPNLAASGITESTVDLSWDASTDDVGVVGYDIYQNSTYIASTTSTTYTATGLAANTTYTFEVRAKDEAGNESVGSIVSATTLESSSGGETIIDEDDYTIEIVDEGSTVTLKFTPKGATSSFVDLHYKVNNGGQINVGTVNNNGTWDYEITGVSEGDEIDFSYTYTLGTPAYDSPTYSYTVGSSGGGNPGDTTPPSAPSNLTATGITETTVDLSWNASTDNVGVTGYDVYQDSTYIGSPASTSFLVTGLTADTTYMFEIKAKDEAGNESSASNSVNVTTATSDTTPPSAPSNITSSGITATSVDLNWDASTDNVGVTGYDIYDGATKIGTTASTTFSVTELTSNTTYTFEIRAKDAAGNESAGSSITVTTLDASSGGGTTINEDDYTIEIIDDGTTVTMKFTPIGATSSFVDLHYKVNNGGQINVRANDINGTWEYEIVNLTQGNEIDFFYTYTLGTPAYDTPSYNYTVQ